MNLESKSIIERTIERDAEAERELIDILCELIALSRERPGGVSIEELAHRLGREQDLHGLRELLERGRSAIEDEAESGGRFAVVERVYDDPYAFWRARYVPTSFGRIYLEGIQAAKKSS